MQLDTDTDAVNLHAIICGNYYVHHLTQNFANIPNDVVAGFIQRSIQHYFSSAVKSFIQCINNFETVQKHVEKVEISTKVDDLMCPVSVCNAFIINEIYTVDNQGNTEISANTNEHCGLECCARDK